MKVVFSSDQIYLHGGIEKVMAGKANYFADVLGYEVYIITTEQKDNQPCYPLSGKIKLVDLDLKYHRDKSYFHPVNLLKIPGHYLKLRKVLKMLRPDVFIVCNFAFDFYWLPFVEKRIFKIKEFHSSRYFEHINRLQNTAVMRKVHYLINDFLESRYDRLIILNPDEKTFYKSANISVIPNPIDISEKLTASLNHKLVLAAGRIAPVKGFEYLIESWKLIAQEENGWQLHIYGEDYLDTQQKLQEIIDKNGLENQIFFKGTTEEMTKTMINYSLYAMSSITECFPMVLLESLSVGLPVVSFDSPTGPKNIITDKEDGFLVEYLNVEMFAEQLLKLMKDENVRVLMGKNAKQNCHRFSNMVIMKQWADLLLKCDKNG